jgi:thiol-disulfide isomerase/thioredoxin
MRTTWMRVWLAVLLLGYLAVVGSETRSAPQEVGDARGDASAFLDGVLKRYATAKTYHIELVEEAQLNGDLRHTWEKQTTTAVVLPNKRYRFEVNSENGWDVDVSDGLSEWFYLPRIGQYTKEPAPASIPGPIPQIPFPGPNSLLQARRTLGKISAPRAWIRSATYLPDEKIDVNGQAVLCTVVQGKGAVPWQAGVNRDIDTTFTFWIDKKDQVIWKETEHREGQFYPDLPHVEFTSDRTVWFKVSEPGAQNAPEGLFNFKPPEGVELVKEFASPREKFLHGLQGRQVPAVNLTGPDGKLESLESFRGKPLLLDFWATWCVPCVESLPALEKLYSETVGKGLVVMSIDSDEDAKKATEFLAKRKAPWPNFHLTDQVVAAFPEHGIPYLVLVDSSGKVVYSYEGLDEPGLRAAVAKLGPEFAGVSETSQPLAKP